MARRPRANPGSPPSPPPFTTRVREVFFTDQTNWADFHKRWAEIDRTLPVLVDPENSHVMVSLRATAREQLRREVREAAVIGPRMYLVPV